MDLEKLKNTIESWSKHHQVEILKIIKKDQSVTINENKSGIYINMTLLQEDILLLVNEIACIVHSSVEIYNGSANKNLGKGFLIV